MRVSPQAYAVKVSMQSIAKHVRWGGPSGPARPQPKLMNEFPLLRAGARLRMHPRRDEPIKTICRYTPINRVEGVGFPTPISSVVEAPNWKPSRMMKLSARPMVIFGVTGVDFNCVGKP